MSVKKKSFKGGEFLLPEKTMKVIQQDEVTRRQLTARRKAILKRFPEEKREEFSFVNERPVDEVKMIPVKLEDIPEGVCMTYGRRSSWSKVPCPDCRYDRVANMIGVLGTRYKLCPVCGFSTLGKK